MDKGKGGKGEGAPAPHGEVGKQHIKNFSDGCRASLEKTESEMRKLVIRQLCRDWNLWSRKEDRWFGHVSGVDDGRLPKQVVHWEANTARERTELTLWDKIWRKLACPWRKQKEGPLADREILVSICGRCVFDTGWTKNNGSKYVSKLTDVQSTNVVWLSQAAQSRCTVVRPMQNQ